MLTTALLVLQLQITAPPVVRNFLPVNRVVRDTTRNYIVIHNDGNNLNTLATRMVLSARRLAYHYFIGRDGTITQFVDLRYVAPHAGVTQWNGITNWNDFSIGVCLQGADWMSYTNEQYASLKKLVNYINMRYPDSREKPLLGHRDIASPAGRKSDPGEHFDFRRIYDDVTDHPRG